MTTFDRQAWLRERHAAWVTPDETLSDLVRQATGAPLASKRRIIKGESNETYHVVNGAGRDLLVKIAHDRPDAFDRLQRYAPLCAEAGVATPQVLHHAVIDGSAAVVQTFLPGAPLDSLLPDLSAEQVADFIPEAGALLARLHSIEEPPRAQSMSAHTMEMLDADLARAADAMAARDLVPDHVRGLVAAHADLLDNWPWCITHGDYGTDHLLVEDGRITGLIDLDMAETGAPYVDLSWWDTYFDWRHPITLLLEGYRRESTIADDERPRILYNLASGVGKLIYFVEVGQPQTADWIANHLNRWIAQIESW